MYSGNIKDKSRRFHSWQDIYTILADWVVALAQSIVHYDPEIYENPFEYTLWRQRRLLVEANEAHASSR